MLDAFAEVKRFLAMGGYGLFVWSAFVLTAVVLTALLVISYRSLRRREAMLAALRRQLDPDRKPPHAA